MGAAFVGEALFFRAEALLAKRADKILVRHRSSLSLDGKGAWPWSHCLLTAASSR
jgi:hypothetical protein